MRWLQKRPGIGNQHWEKATGKTLVTFFVTFFVTAPNPENTGVFCLFVTSNQYFPGVLIIGIYRVYTHRYSTTESLGRFFVSSFLVTKSVTNRENAIIPPEIEVEL